MAKDSKIEWTHHTANLWWGCEEVHEGCDNCYAKAWAKRYQPVPIWGKETPRMEIKGVWKAFEKYQRLAEAAGEVHRVFVGSMMDIAEKPMFLINRLGVQAIDVNDNSPIDNTHIRQRYFNEVIPSTPNLLHLLLTKRPSNFNKIIPERWKTSPPANVMFGTSIVKRSQLVTLLKQLKRVNGKRFLSLEPQLENIPNIDLNGIHWVIQGGESGPGKRPFDTDWARSMKYQCQVQQVPYFFKQVDKIQSIPDDLHIRQFPVLA
ncbi:DUF5131 family protein [Spirosoma sp. HMF4905]|uniref:DUF5131 family protein n=1 Tax=Spirosoma arboris TaxID=2682092 RepID=A0A7K1SIM0_9BACT|nr:DUF5131 family protein [Spirosoma arboris]MVM33623.1 DUF5131 family protein [Spirosoma arboris]